MKILFRNIPDVTHLAQLAAMLDPAREEEIKVSKKKLIMINVMKIKLIMVI